MHRIAGGSRYGRATALRQGEEGELMMTMRSSLVRRTGRLTVLALVLSLLLGVVASAALGRASVDWVEGPFETVVPVAFADNPAGVELMFAKCDFVLRVEKPNGASREIQRCHLTEPFVEFPGTPPTEVFRNKEGPCVWFSDYFAQATGETVWAESVRLAVTPSGNVFVTTRYPADPLACD